VETQRASYVSFPSALAQAHLDALRTRRTMYVFALVADGARSEARYVVRSRATLPPALPVARVDAYIESGGAFTTPAPEEV